MKWFERKVVACQSFLQIQGISWFSGQWDDSGMLCLVGLSFNLDWKLPKHYSCQTRERSGKHNGVAASHSHDRDDSVRVHVVNNLLNMKRLEKTISQEKTHLPQDQEHPSPAGWQHAARSNHQTFCTHLPCLTSSPPAKCWIPNPGTMRAALNHWHITGVSVQTLHANHTSSQYSC